MGIAVLDKDTIDKIAAGEVVERPASIVKELVENAIDAGATAVTVEVKEGGISFIRITDNGCGIAADEVRLAFLRHATSKIRTAEDLTGIASLGFRGEALSSIAAVARVEIITKTPEALTGVRYCIEGGEEKSFEEVGAPSGTTFLVRNLFYNTPARAKFLKTAMTEGNAVTTVVEQLALSNPGVSFKYIQGGQTRLHTSGNRNLKELVYHIFGREISRELVEIESVSTLMEIRGFVAKPSVSRGNRNFENYYVNGRYVKSKLLARAIEDGYHGFMMQHKYPFTLLYIQMDGTRVDVNVHPAKMELRFSNQEAIYDQMEGAIREALMKRERIPEVTVGRESREKERKPAYAPAPEPFERERLRREQGEKVRVLPQSYRPAEEKSFGGGSLPIYPSGRREISGAPFAPGRGRSEEKEAGLFREEGAYGREASAGTEDRGARPKEGALFADAQSYMENEQNASEGTLEKKERTVAPAEGSAGEYREGPEPMGGSQTPAPGGLPERPRPSGGTGEHGAEENAAERPAANAGDGKENAAEDTGEWTGKRSAGDGGGPDGIEHAGRKDQENAAERPEQLELFDGRLLSKEARTAHKIIGQVFDTYWLVEFGENLYIIDQHAAHEKVLYEKMMREYGRKEILSQLLSPPLIVTLKAQEAELLRRYAEVFSAFGFEIEPFGGREYQISAVPSNLYGIATDALFLEILDQLEEGGGRSVALISEKLASMSCKAAVKGNNRLSRQEAEALIDELLTLENPYNCPHGRPTIISMSKYELEKKFKRIV